MVLPLVVSEEMIRDFHLCAEKGDYQQLFDEYQAFFDGLAECLKQVSFSSNQLCSVLSRESEFLFGYLTKWNPNDSKYYGNLAVEVAVPGFIQHLKQAISTKKWDGFYQQFRPTADIMIQEARSQGIIEMKVEYGPGLYENFAKRDEAMVAAKKKKEEEEKNMLPPTPQPRQSEMRLTAQSHDPINQSLHGRSSKGRYGQHTVAARFDRSSSPQVVQQCGDEMGSLNGTEASSTNLEKNLFSDVTMLNSPEKPTPQLVPPPLTLSSTDNTDRLKGFEEILKNNNQIMMDMFNLKFQEMESRINASFETKINNIETQLQQKFNTKNSESNKTLQNKLERLSADVNIKFKEQETQIEGMEKKIYYAIGMVVKSSEDNMKAKIEGLVVSNQEFLKENFKTQITHLEAKMQEFGETLVQQENYSWNETEKLVTPMKDQKEDKSEVEVAKTIFNGESADKSMGSLVEAVKMGMERQKHQIDSNLIDSEEKSDDEYDDAAENIIDLQEVPNLQDQPELQEQPDLETTPTDSNSENTSLSDGFQIDDDQQDQPVFETTPANMSSMKPPSTHGHVEDDALQPAFSTTSTDSNTPMPTTSKDSQEDEEIRRIIKEHEIKLAEQNRAHETELQRVRARRRDMNTDAEEERRQMSASLNRGTDGMYSLRHS